MKNKLHIFGCSHSTGIHCDDIKAPWWKDYIQKAFNLDVYRRQGQSGKNVEYILFDIAERLLEGEIQKDDLVILNTSYPLRFGTPRLQKFSKHPMDVNFDSDGILGIKRENFTPVDKLDNTLTFNLWYHQTFMAWKVLDSVCDNVYQWTLLDHNEMDDLYMSINYDLNHPELGKKSKLPEYQMYGMEKIGTPSKNPWKNIIKYPSEYNNWDNFIYKHKHHDGHMAPEHHSKFAQIFIDQIDYEI